MNETTDFILTDRGMVARAAITSIDMSRLESDAMIIIHHRDGVSNASGLFAFEAMMLCKPSALEGRALRYHRNAWIRHNLISHPLMQMTALAAMLVRPVSVNLSARWYKKAIRIHDATVPRPCGIRGHVSGSQPQQHLRA